VANRNGRILHELVDAIDLLVEALPEPTYHDPRGHRADTLDIDLSKNVPFQRRLRVVNALNSGHLPVLMHIGDEANDAQIGRSSRKFWKPTSDRFVGLNRLKTSKTQPALSRKKS
jgi:hypothetical protein